MTPAAVLLDAVEQEHRHARRGHLVHDPEVAGAAPHDTAGRQGFLIFIAILLGCILPLPAAVLLVVFAPSMWWVIPLYLAWEAVLIVILMRVVRAHSEVIDMNEAIAALCEKQGGRRA